MSEEYRCRTIVRLCFALGLSGTTFVSKTTTLVPRAGMSKRKIELGSGVIVHANDLAGPGLEALLAKAVWQARTEAFCISFAAIGETRELRMIEYCQVVTLLAQARSQFRAPFALVITIASPEIRRMQEELADEMLEALSILNKLGVPLVVQVGVGIAPATAAEILACKECDALAVSAPIPWSEVPENVRKVFFRTQKSPFESLGGGAVSGKYLLPLVVEWVRQFKRLSPGKPVIGGGGILRSKDLDELLESGVAAVSLGSVFMVRPFNVSSIIKRATKLLK